MTDKAGPTPPAEPRRRDSRAGWHHGGDHGGNGWGEDELVPTSYWGGVGGEVGTALFWEERLERCRLDAACGALGRPSR
jgi:hypothetical protein